MAKVYDNANDLITFARSSGGTSLRRVSYGDELVTNGTFTTTDISAWDSFDGTLAVVGGELELTYTNVTQYVWVEITTTPGTLYEFSVDCRSANAVGHKLLAYSDGFPSGTEIATNPSYVNLNTSLTTQTLKVKATTSTTLFMVATQLTSGTAYFDNVSVKEVFLDRATDPLVEFNHPYDMPRIDFDTNGVAKGLLIEEQRTNLLHSTDNPPSQATDVSAGSHTLSFTAGPSTSSIDQTLDNVNAVDVFVYDTKNDTDGGAWRTGSRAQASSWYNETLNTDTRGARREFPEVAVIVAEANKVTIYDGDDPSLPMWMVFGLGIGSLIGSFNSVSMRNGIMCAGSPASLNYSGMLVARFLNDDAIGVRGHVYWNLHMNVPSISDRNGTWQQTGSRGFLAYDSSSVLVNPEVNDVAMTVLPDAPIDPNTGLPVPTIAVATDGGLSVINNDGTVYDSSYTSSLSNVGFWADGTVVYGRDGFTAQVLRAEPSAYQTADGFGTYILHGSLSLPTYFPYQSGLLYLPFGDNEVAGGNPSETTSTNSIPCLGRYIIGSTLPQSMGCVTTSSYTTGWMNGDIKLAGLADTNTSSLVGSGELLVDGSGNWVGDFDVAADVSEWTAINNAVLTHESASGRMRVANGATGRAGAEKTITTTVGQRYRVTFDGIPGTAPDIFLYVGTVSGGANVVGLVNVNGTGLSLDFVAESTTTYLQFLPSNTGNGNYAEFDNISVKLADADRSVNNKGLIVNGTITRSPVETGADLVGYSNFSSSNYLEQPYNSDLDFGQGDFCVMGWFKGTDPYGVFMTTGTTGHQEGFFCGVTGFTGEGKYSFTLGDNTASSSHETAISSTIEANKWVHVTFVVDSGDVKIYENGSLLYGPTATTRSVAGGGPLIMGYRPWDNAQNYSGSLALWRISATAPTAEQIAKIYNDEKLLFQPNAKATLDGTSDAVTALTHDPETDLLHVGTNQSRSVFYGLRRINQTGTAVTTAISAVDGLISEQ